LLLSLRCYAYLYGGCKSNVFMNKK
jgi:hypothetical protein